MPKYIDADALQKRMEQIAEESKPAATARPMREDTPSELLRYGTARAMIEWINEIPAADVEPKRRWIPVTERLPKHLTSVIVHRKDGGIFIWEYFDTSPTDECWIDDSANVYLFYDVTHWMPLPEPPKEEKEEPHD